METAQLKHKEAVDTLKAEHEQKLIDLEGEQVRQLEELEKRHQTELDDCVTGCKEEITLARKEQQELLDNLQVLAAASLASSAIIFF